MTNIFFYFFNIAVSYFTMQHAHSTGYKHAFYASGVVLLKISDPS
jgi:hypothetical protein